MFLHRNGKLLIPAKPSNVISKILSIIYQKIPPYTTAVIQTKFENTMQLEKENSSMIKAHYESVDSNTSLRCYPTHK